MEGSEMRTNSKDGKQADHVSDKENTAGVYSFHSELSKVEELSRMLKETQQRLNEASMRSHLLNIDVVTLFDPHLTDKLRQTTEQCENCLQRMKEREDHMNQLIEN